VRAGPAIKFTRRQAPLGPRGQARNTGGMFLSQENKMSITPYHRHPAIGGGRPAQTIYTEEGAPVVLKTFSEQLRAAQIMDPLLKAGFPRAFAEAEAARAILGLRCAKKFFGR